MKEFTNLESAISYAEELYKTARNNVVIIKIDEVYSVKEINPGELITGNVVRVFEK